MINLQLSNEQVILTEAQVAKMLGVSPRTIRNYRREGKLRYFQPIKKVYICYADVLEFLTSKAKKINGATNEK
jgi:excisionase family DNA binding protein